MESQAVAGCALPFPAESTISPRIAMMTELPAPVAKIRMTIRSDLDILTARQKGRALAKELDFSSSEATLFAAIISELGRDILAHAYSGEVALEPLQQAERVGVRLIAAYGQGSIVRASNVIVGPDAPADGFVLAEFPVAHLLDEIRFQSQPGSGVTLTGIKWRGQTNRSNHFLKS